MNDDASADEAQVIVDPHLARVAVHRRMLRLRLEIVLLLQRLNGRCPAVSAVRPALSPPLPIARANGNALHRGDPQQTRASESATVGPRKKVP